MTPAHERKAAERQRKKAAGLMRCEVWVHPVVAMQIKLWAQDVTKELSAALPDLLEAPER